MRRSCGIPNITYTTAQDHLHVAIADVVQVCGSTLNVRVHSTHIMNLLFFAGM